MKNNKIPEEYLEEFKSWILEPHEKEFQAYTPYGANIIIKLFYYDADKQEEIEDEGKKSKVKIILPDEMKNLNSKLFPIAKVMKVSKGCSNQYLELKPSNIVTISDYLAESDLNDDWVDYQSKILSQPGLKDSLKQPPMYKGNIAAWNRYAFRPNKLKELTREDLFTFCVPEGFIISEYSNK